MKTKTWASALLALCLFLVVSFTLVGVTLPWWLPKILTHYTSDTAYRVQIPHVGWSHQGLRLPSLRLSVPNLDIQLNDVAIRWHGWNSGPQFTVVSGPAAIKLKGHKARQPLTTASGANGLLGAIDFTAFATLFSRVTLIELPIIEVMIEDTNLIWASMQATSSASIDTPKVRDIHVNLALLSKRPETNSLHDFNLRPGDGQAIIDAKQPQSWLYLGLLELSENKQSWSLSNRLYLSSLQHWIMHTPSAINAKWLTLLEPLTSVRGTASIELGGQFQEQQWMILPLHGQLTLDSSIGLKTTLGKVTALTDPITPGKTPTNDTEDTRSVHTHHQISVSWPFSFDTEWSTGPIELRLLGQRLTPIANADQPIPPPSTQPTPVLNERPSNDPWPNVWNVELSIPKLEGQAAHLSGSAVVNAQLSGYQWESRLQAQASKIHCKKTSNDHAPFFNQKFNVDDLDCQLFFQTEIASESQHLDLMGTATSHIAGKLSLQQQRLNLLLNKALAEIHDLSSRYGSAQRVSLSADALAIKIKHPLELSGRLQGVVQQAILKSRPPLPSDITEQQRAVKPMTPIAKPVTLSAQFSAEVAPKLSPKLPPEAKIPLAVTPVQHRLRFRLDALDLLTFDGSADLRFPQSYPLTDTQTHQHIPFGLSHFVLEQQPISASELQSLLAKVNLLPDDLQLTSGQASTKLFAQDLVSDQTLIEVGVNINGLSMQQDQKSIQGLDACLLLRGTQTQLLSQGLDQNSIHINRMNVGLPLDNLNAKLFVEIHPKAEHSLQLTFNQLELEALGGTANIAKLQAWPLTQSTNVLELNNLDLSQLLKLQSQPGISASGRLQGHLPFGFDPSGALFIKQGTLRATPAGGHISVKDNPSAQAFKAKNPQLKQAFEALEYLEFSTLTSDASMSATGDLVLKARIEGKNPQQKNNRPILFNYTHEENLYFLLKSLLIGDQMAKKVENKVKMP